MGMGGRSSFSMIAKQLGTVILQSVAVPSFVADRLRQRFCGKRRACSARNPTFKPVVLISMGWKSVFESDFRLPERVCIVAPGPNGVGHYDQIPAGFSVIAVSKAVLIPDLHADVWMMNHVHQVWYERASNFHRGIRIFHHDAVKALEQTANAHGAEDCYFFTPPDEPLGLEQFMPVDGCIRIGASISACAVQLAYNFGAREILLCGVDMSGDAYFDRTLNSNPNHGETWPATARLNVLINWLRVQRGLRIATISPTKLDVPPVGSR